MHENAISLLENVLLDTVSIMLEIQKSGFESESELGMFIYGRELDFGEFGFDWINMVIYCSCLHISLCNSCSNKYSHILYV